MKKIILSIAAVAALAACTKSEVQYEQQTEIGLAPVSKLNTKAAVPNTDYPDGLKMYVFANAGEASDAVPGGYDEPYLGNALFEHRTNDAANVFGGSATPYYWPNVKKLIFSGYSQSGNTVSLNSVVTTKPTYTWNGTTWVININNYAPGDGTAVVGDNDLMWFPTTTQSYGKPTGNDNSPVEVVMQHACAWVTINIKGDSTTGADDTTWQILDLSIADLSQSANVTLGTIAVWSDLATGTPFDVYRGTGKQLTTGYVDYTKLESSYQDFIVIPQATKTLTIKYSYTSQKGGAADGTDIVVQEIKSVPLTYTSDEGWKAGVHYTYNITIGTKEILIEPRVTEWTTQSTLDIIL